MNDKKLLFIFILAPDFGVTNSSMVFLDRIVSGGELNFFYIHKMTINHNFEEVHLDQVKIGIET